MKTARLLIASCLLLAGAVAAAPAPVVPGPPGLCSAFEVGDAVKGLDGAFKDLAKDKVNATLVKLLDEHAAHAAVRMEVIRRAVFVRDAKPDALEEMALHVTTRALLAKGSEKERAAALFDAGYFLYTASILGAGPCSTLAVEDGMPGYALVTRALAAHDDPEMQVGACYITVPRMHASADEPGYARFAALFRAHAAKAARASSDPLVANNLKIVLGIEGLSLSEVTKAAPSGGASR